MQDLLHALKAAGEHTRLRLLALLAHGELTVSELTQILGQSQPRVSRHLKLLFDANLVERFQEGTWVFYRLADRGAAGELARTLIGFLPEDDTYLIRDEERLRAVRAAHAKVAEEYFREHAESWDRVRDLYMADADVEQLMLRLLGSTPINDFLDLGTGTGRVLEVVSGHSERALGIDSSREMLSVARANLTAKELHNCQVRHGNIYALDLPDGCMDAVSIHHVLHFLDEPAAAIAQAARTLRPGGRLLVVDLAPHRLEFLRTEFAHRRLGFADEEVAAWCTEAGLKDVTAHHIEKAAPGTGQDERFCIAVWSAVQHAEASAHYTLDVA